MRQNKLINKKPGSSAVLSMAGCYAMGNFTDNYFKQAAVLMAAAGGLTGLQSLATVLFALPFILFSAWAGWLADRAPKKNIVVASKVMELSALCLGAIALWQAWWTGILLVVFLMALQSTIFNPALNGAIPENFSAHDVPRVNSVVRSISTASILAGIALAGPFLDMRPGGPLPALGGSGGAEYGRIAAGIFMLLVSFSGLLLALTIKSNKTPAPERRAFPWLGPLDSLRHLAECRKDKALFTVMTGDAFFYGLAPVAVISIANLGKGLGYSDTVTSALSASLMIGIAIGALAAGRSTPESWRERMIPALFCIALFLGLAGLTPLLPHSIGLGWFTLTLLAAGFWGGVYIIPIASFMQVRPAQGEKGKVIAASNFYSFTSMALFGAFFKVISLLPPALTFPVYTALCLAFALLWVRPRLPLLEGSTLKDLSGSPLGLFFRALLSLRYKVIESGLDKIGADPEAKKRPILFLPNHPALIDPVIIYSRIAGLRPRPLSDAGRMSGPVEKLLVKILRVITVPDVKKDGRESVKAVRRSLSEIAAALKQGDNILLYPSGRIYASENETIGANSGLIKILAEVPDVRVVLVRSGGLWGSSFSRAGGASPQFFKVLRKRLPALLANLLFFMPRRVVTLEFEEVTLDMHDKMVMNRRLEAWYNQVSRPAFTVPLWFWQGSKPVKISEGRPRG